MVDRWCSAHDRMVGENGHILFSYSGAMCNHFVLLLFSSCALYVLYFPTTSKKTPQDLSSVCTDIWMVACKAGRL